MNRLHSLLAALVIGSAAELSTAATIELEGLNLDDSAQVAGKHLKLNGAGVGVRFLFKVYLISLYLTEHKHTPEDILATEGPLRVELIMLRDVSGNEFRKALAETLAETAPAPGAARFDPAGAMRLATSIAEHPGGLRKGDVLTFDWMPGVGTVVRINNKALAEPVPDKTLYAALLNIWIGPKPADSALKTKLLGKLRNV